MEIDSIIIAALINAVAVLIAGIWAARIIANAKPNENDKNATQTNEGIPKRKPDWMWTLSLLPFLLIPASIMFFADLSPPATIRTVFLIAILISESSLGIVLLIIARFSHRFAESLNRQYGIIDKLNDQITDLVALVTQIKKSAFRKSPLSSKRNKRAG